MQLTTFNEKAYKETLLEEGREEVKILYRKLIEDGRQEDLEKALYDSSYEEQLLDKYHLK